MSADGPTGERQEHLVATISFAGAGQRRRMFRGRDILTNKCALGDLPEDCRFLLNTQLMFLKKEKDPTTKLFDDDELLALSEGVIAALTTAMRQLGVGSQSGAEALAIFRQLI